jgi:hypothetical protein
VALGPCFPPIIFWMKSWRGGYLDLHQRDSCLRSCAEPITVRWVEATADSHVQRGVCTRQALLICWSCVTERFVHKAGRTLAFMDSMCTDVLMRQVLHMRKVCSHILRVHVLHARNCCALYCSARRLGITDVQDEALFVIKSHFTELVSSYPDQVQLLPREWYQEITSCPTLQVMACPSSEL